VIYKTNKTNEYDASDLELKSSQEEEKPLSNKVDEIFRPPRGTGEIKNYFGEKFLSKDNLIKLDEKLSKYCENIIGLHDNWDDQGSKAITIEIWNYTTALLRKILYNLWYNGFNISIPLVLPNTDGSFDIYWEPGEFELLINIPSNRMELVHMYGEKSGSPEYELEARINYELVQGVIVEWIKKIL